MFTRTASGQAAQYLFYSDKVVVWVEGQDDLVAYHPFLSRYGCVVKAAGGKRRCLELADSMPSGDSPFVVVVDGDYDFIERSRSPHRQLVWLQRYSVENYFVDHDVISFVCESISPESNLDSGSRCMTQIDDAIQSIRLLMGFDYKLVCDGVGERAMPQKFERVAVSPSSTAVSEESVSRLIDDCPLALDDLEGEIDKLESRGLAKALRGHFAFGLLRNVLRAEIAERGSRLYMNDQNLLAFLSQALWSVGADRDHKSLKRRLSYAIRTAQRVVSALAV